MGVESYHYEFMMMAMVRLNVPSIFIYGGSILPGNFRGQQVTVQDMTSMMVCAPACFGWMI